MKNLFLIRHAKSRQIDSGQEDINRPLNDRGRMDAPFMAKKFADTAPRSVLLLSSPANRAYTTCLAFAKEMKIPVSSIAVEIDIYEATVNTLLEIVEGLSDEFGAVAIFGHNPGMSLFAEYLTRVPLSFPTCGIAEIHFPISSWREVSENAGTLINFDYPQKYIQ
ncbi:MAG: histidine phosphatase family protein [Crocinitomicaceae bacterium]|nr:histidine phosphatase family protein [Crocinitomicaceae bacterium]